MSYIICFWDKSKIQVEDNVADVLKKLILAEQIKNFELGQNMYAVSSVEKIITKQVAYEVFPEQYQQLQDMEDIQPPSNFEQLSSGEKGITLS